MAIDSAAVEAAGRSFRYQADQHRWWRLCAAGLLAGWLSTAFAFALYLARHDTVYVPVAATPDGRLVKLTPLSEPIMSDAALKNWTVSAVVEAFTLGHHDWRMRLSAIRELFTDDGYDSFLQGLEESQFLTRLRDNLQVASTVARGAPVITETRLFRGRAGWQIEFPILVTFQAGRRRVDQDLVARVLVMRVPLSERFGGIGIAQLIAARRSG